MAQDGDALRAALARDLPAFMLPRAIHWRDTMPLSANGKLDRAGLYLALTQDD
jgi:acyl-CoA synthetase (AMP-forming)/AMP-acid ligase II